MEKNYNRKQKLFIRIILYLFLFAQFAFIEPVQSQTKNSKTKQETLQYEVTVTLKLIQVYVTDKKGNPVTYLKKSDFELYDNGKLKKITDFEKHILSISKEKTKKIQSNVSPEIPTSLNRKFFLFFDLAFNDAGGILKAKKAALHFIDTQLHPTDEVGVISYHTNKGLTLHEYFTSDHQKSREVVQGVGVKEFLGRAQDIDFRYWEDREELVKKIKHTNREIYKAQVLNFSKEIKDLARALRYVPGSKHIILFSGGVANFVLYGDVSLHTMYEKMSKELAASNSPVYAVNTAGLASAHFKDRDMMGDHSLNQLAKLSGGKYFDNIVNYEKIMEDIQNATSSYYVLGYYIDEKWDGKYNKVKVKVKRKGCIVYGQRGYFNPKPFTEYTEFEKQLHLMDLALSERPHFQEPLNFPLLALPYSVKEKSHLVVLTKIPTERIKEVLGRKVEIVTLFFDGQNNIVELKRDEVSASKLARDNVYFYSSSILSPGEYDCRVVIRNLETGKGAVASSSAIVPESPDSGIILYPPLLLIPEKNAFYLKGSASGKKAKKGKQISLLDIYPFPYTQYSPLVEGLNQGISKLLAVVRCSTSNIQQPEIRLSAHLIHLSSGKKTHLSLSVLNQSQEEDTQIFLLELQIDELQPGRYSLQLSAKEMTTQSRSHIMTTFLIR
jgi:VWFA-related protein